MNGARATAFEALGRISAELAAGPLEEHRGPMLAGQIRRAVEEIARKETQAPEGVERLARNVSFYAHHPLCDQHDDALIADNTLGIPDLTIGDLRAALRAQPAPATWDGKHCPSCGSAELDNVVLDGRADGPTVPGCPGCGWDSLGFTIRQPAPAGEPVAWAWRPRGGTGRWGFVMQPQRPDYAGIENCEVVPLYAGAPAPAMEPPMLASTAWLVIDQWREEAVRRRHDQGDVSWRQADEATPDPVPTLKDAIHRAIAVAREESAGAPALATDARKLLAEADQLMREAIEAGDPDLVLQTAAPAPGGAARDTRELLREEVENRRASWKLKGRDPGCSMISLTPSHECECWFHRADRALRAHSSEAR